MKSNLGIPDLPMAVPMIKDPQIIHYGHVSRVEFNALQREVLELKKMFNELIKKIQKSDDATSDNSGAL